MKKLILISLAICLVSCGVGHEKNRTRLGKILDANVVPTSFNEAPKTQIKTEKSVIVVFGIVSVELGKESYGIEYDSGLRYFTWDGNPMMYRY